MKTLAVVALLAAAGVSFAPQEGSGLHARHLAARQEQFMVALKAGRLEKAYEDLIKGSRLADKEGLLATLVKETGQAIVPIGEVRDWDSQGILWQEKHQAFGSAILCGKDYPLYFYFTWYRSTEHERWVLTNVWFGDEVQDYWAARR